MAIRGGGINMNMNSTVYVYNLPTGTDEEMLADYFGTIGLLKVCFSPGNNQTPSNFSFHFKFPFEKYQN